MIKLQNSRFTDILPDNIAGNLEVRALSYAVGRQITKVCAYADAARTYAAVATLPDKVLDILAVELRTPAYKEHYPIGVKRALIIDTLSFYMKMGTPSAINKIIEIIFETGYIEEWPEYGGEPHHFRAYVGENGGAIGPGDLEEFRRVLVSVKRLSSWIDDIITIATMEPDTLTFTGRMGRGYMVTTLPEALKDYKLAALARGGGAFGTITQTAIPPAEQ